MNLKRIITFFIIPCLVLTCLVTIVVSKYVLNGRLLVLARDCVGRDLRACNLGIPDATFSSFSDPSFKRITLTYSSPKRAGPFSKLIVYEDDPIGIVLVYCDARGIVLGVEEIFP